MAKSGGGLKVGCLSILWNTVRVGHFGANVDKSRRYGLGTDVDKSQQQGAECCDVTYVSTIVDR